MIAANSPPPIGPTIELGLLYATVLFGALVTQILSLTRNFNGSQAFLKQFAPNISDTMVFRIDFATLTVLGSIIGMILFDPHDYKQALLAGIGWITSVQALAHSAQN